jgi:hypothetical protein
VGWPGWVAHSLGEKGCSLWEWVFYFFVFFVSSRSGYKSRRGAARESAHGPWRLEIAVVVVMAVVVMGAARRGEVRVKCGPLAQHSGDKGRRRLQRTASIDCRTS